MKGRHEGTELRSAPLWAQRPGFLSALTKAKKSPSGLIFALYHHNHLLLTSDLISHRCTMSAGLRGPTERS